MQQIRLLVMCDSRSKGSSLSAIFSCRNNFTVLGQTEISEKPLTEVQKMQPDAVLINFAPEKKILCTLKLLREVCPYSKVFVFVESNSALESLAIITETDGCLTSSLLPQDLVNAVELTCRTGIFFLPPSVKKLLSDQREGSIKISTKNEDPVTSCTESIIKNGPNLPLTGRELEIYELIIKNLSNKEIGKKLFISQPTVKSHVSSILRKLGLNNRTQLLFNEMQNRHLNKPLSSESSSKENKIIQL